MKNVNNFAQWVCDACRTDGVPPLAYCKGCESLAVSSEGQLSEGDTRSLNLQYQYQAGVTRSCSSCFFLGRGSRSHKVHSRTTWCRGCIAAHKCFVCHKLVQELDAVSLCIECPKYGRKNFAQWSCKNCSDKGAFPSRYCSVCVPPSVKPAVVEIADRSFDFAYVYKNKKQEDPRCKSCVFLGRGIRSGKTVSYTHLTLPTTVSV